MSDIDLEALSLKELKELQVQVNRAIATFEDRRKREALARIEETARDMGFSLSELTGFQTPKKRKPASAKYANPANTEQTWTGRGRRPRWVEEALAEGRDMADLEI